MQNTAVKTSKIKIELLNLDKISTKILQRIFVTNLSKLACLIKSNQHADIIIADHDIGTPDNLLNILIEKNQYAIIMFSELENTIIKHPRVTYLKKTINSSELETCILNAYNKLNSNRIKSVASQKNNKTKAKNINQLNLNDKNSHLYHAIHRKTKNDKKNRYRAHKYVGGNKDINPNNKTELTNIFLTPEKYLFHYLVKAQSLAIKSQSDVLIKTAFSHILFSHKLQKFYHGFDDKKMNYLQTSALFDGTVLELISLKPESTTIKSNVKNSTEMIWESAINASKGRVPKYTSLHSKVDMSMWPNFSKIKIFRYALQISATWAKNKLTLIETAEQLNIPQRYVFTLYCAMNAINCASVDNTSISRTNNENITSKIFSKITTHLFNK